jgi:beta-lactamase regulating signal transducer with metallopeptidase domain
MVKCLPRVPKALGSILKTTKPKQNSTKTTHQSLFIWVISVFILNFYFVCIHKTKENTKSRAIQVLPEQGTLPPGKIKK